MNEQRIVPMPVRDAERLFLWPWTSLVMATQFIRTGDFRRHEMVDTQLQGCTVAGATEVPTARPLSLRLSLR